MDKKNLVLESNKSCYFLPKKNPQDLATPLQGGGYVRQNNCNSRQAYTIKSTEISWTYKRTGNTGKRLLLAHAMSTVHYSSVRHAGKNADFKK